MRAAAAEPAAIHDGDRGAEFARLVGGGLAGRTGADDDEVEGIHGFSLRFRHVAIALATRLVEQDRRADRHVQAVGDAVHRDANGLDVIAAPGVGQAVRLGAEDDRERPAQVRIGVGPLGVDPGRDDPEAAGPSQARTSAAGRRAERDREDRPGAGPDRVRVEQVGARRRGDDRVRAGAVGRTEDRAQVARLLDALDDDDERVRRQVEPLEREVRDADHGHQALGPLAEGELLEDAFTGGDGFDAGGLESVERSPCVRAGQQRLAHERLDHVDPGIDGSPDLAGAIDDRQAAPVALAPVAQGRHGRDPRVGAAGQVGRCGCAHRWHHAPPVSRAKAPKVQAPPIWCLEREFARLDPVGGSSTGRPPAPGQPVGPEPRRVGGQQDEAVGLEDGPAAPRKTGEVSSRAATGRPPSRARTRAGRGRSRRSDARDAPRARRTHARRRRSSGPGRSVRPESSALRRAQATVGRDASTCVTDAPAAASASVASPV